MTNKEFYERKFDKSLSDIIGYEEIGLYHGKLRPCLLMECEDCDFYLRENIDCGVLFNEWLDEEYEPTIQKGEE